MSNFSLKKDYVINASVSSAKLKVPGVKQLSSKLPSAGDLLFSGGLLYVGNGREWELSSSPSKQVTVSSAQQLTDAIANVTPGSHTIINLSGSPSPPYTLTDIVRDDDTSFSFIGDTRHTVGMTYVNGAQEDWGIRTLVPTVYPELGGGSGCVLAFGVNTITVTFTLPSELVPSMLPYDPDFSELKAGDTLSVYDPMTNTSIIVTVSSVTTNTITIVESGSLPILTLGTSVTINPNSIVYVSGSPCHINLNGLLNFVGCKVSPTPTSQLFLASGLTSVKGCVFDSNVVILGNEIEFPQPNTWFQTLQIDTGVRVVGWVQSFVGQNSASCVGRNPFTLLYFSNWICSNNSAETQPGIPNAGLIMINGGELNIAYSTFIKCALGLSLSSSTANVQHTVFDSCGVSVDMLYNSSLLAEPLHRAIAQPTAFLPTVNNSTIAGIQLSYACQAVVPGILMSGNASDFVIDGIPSMKGPGNNWTPNILAAPPPSVYGSLVYHT